MRLALARRCAIESSWHNKYSIGSRTNIGSKKTYFGIIYSVFWGQLCFRVLCFVFLTGIFFHLMPLSYQRKITFRN